MNDKKYSDHECYCEEIKKYGLECTPCREKKAIEKVEVLKSQYDIEKMGYQKAINALMNVKIDIGNDIVCNVYGNAVQFLTDNMEEVFNHEKEGQV